MTYTLVNANTYVTSTTGTLTATSTSTTAGNLLTLAIAAANTTSSVTLTLPAGWVRAGTFYATGIGGGTQADVWYYPNNPGGITSVVISGFSGALGQGAQLMEFHDSAGSSTSPLDVTGAPASTTVSPFAVATGSATTTTHELAVVAYSQYFASATKVTVAAGTGFTQAGSFGDGIKQSTHFAAHYQLDTGASLATVTDSVASLSGDNSQTGVIATFKIAPPAAPVIQSASAVGTGASPSATYTSNVAAGTKLVAAVSLSTSQGQTVGLSSVCTVADGASHSMTFIGGVATAATNYLGLFAMDTPAGDVGTKPVITATVNASVNNFGTVLLIQEVSGLAVGNTLAAMIDGTLAATTATSTGPATTAAYTSAAAGEYLVAVYGDPGDNLAYSNPATGYNADLSNVRSNSNAELGFNYKNSAGGAESASWTLGGTAQWATLLVAFKLPGAPSGILPQQMKHRAPAVFTRIASRNAGGTYTR